MNVRRVEILDAKNILAESLGINTVFIIKWYKLKVLVGIKMLCSQALYRCISCALLRHKKRMVQYWHLQ